MFHSSVDAEDQQAVSSEGLDSVRCVMLFFMQTASNILCKYRSLYHPYSIVHMYYSYIQ